MNGLLLQMLLHIIHEMVMDLVEVYDFLKIVMTLSVNRKPQAYSLAQSP